MKKDGMVLYKVQSTLEKWTECLIRMAIGPGGFYAPHVVAFAGLTGHC